MVRNGILRCVWRERAAWSVIGFIVLGVAVAGIGLLVHSGHKVVSFHLSLFACRRC
jgi:hypothetical protein